jgi:hypothetical protein
MKKLHEFYAGTGTALLVGNPAASAINAPSGKRYDAWKDAYGNALVDREYGGAIGLLGGAGIGAGAGALAMRSKSGKSVAAKLSGGGDVAERLAKFKALKKAATPAGALIGGLAGLGIGGFAGLAHGHYGKRAQEIRNRHLEANLKPALRELAARSEQLKEFAMVRDGSGRYVEVEDGGMGVGGAIKAGVGAAALGGAGYGAYKGHQAVMNKFLPGVKDGFVKEGYSQYRNTANGSMPASFAKAQSEQDFAKLGKFGQTRMAYASAAKTGAGSLAAKPGLLGKLGKFAMGKFA